MGVVGGNRVEGVCVGVIGVVLGETLCGGSGGNMCCLWRALCGLKLGVGLLPVGVMEGELYGV